MIEKQSVRASVFSIVLIIFCLLVLVLLINNQYVFEGAIFMNNQQCSLHPLKRNIPFTNFTVILGNSLKVHGWRLFPSSNEKVLIFVQGAGGMKSHSILYAEQLHTIFPDFEILLFDYPGHGASDGERNMCNSIATIEKINDITSAYKTRLWVTNCFGSIILFKTIEAGFSGKYLEPSRDSVITINGMLHPFQHGIKPWPNWFMIGFLNLVTKQSIYSSLNGRRGLEMLLEANVPVKSIHWQRDPWVSIRHGDEFEKLVGCDHYMSYAGNATHYKLAMNDDRLIKFLQS